MTQQISPFIEGKYGWNFGESGWNSGMDENLLKFSFLFNGNVDEIVSTLPTAVNGKSVFLTTDNRLYFAVGAVWYSSPCPKWFHFRITSTGDLYEFNGTSAAKLDTPSQTDARIDAIELTVSTLGSAAYEDIAFFATQSELDVESANATAYTDTLRSDLSDSTDPTKGAKLVGRSVRSVTDIAELRTAGNGGRYDGDQVQLLEYGGTSVSGIGGGLLVWDNTSTEPDDGGIVFAVSGITTGRWKRVVEGEINANWYGLPLTSGTCYNEMVNIEAAMVAYGVGLYAPAGIYDVGDNNFPFRNPEIVSPTLKDYGGAVIRGDGEKTIFKTTTPDGADVLQLNAVQGLTIRSLKLTSTLTGTTGAGCNGVSITNGGKDIDLDIICEDLPYVDKTNYLDGGKALSIQPGSSSNPVENIRARVVAKNVGYGFGMDINNEVRINNPMKGINVNIYVEKAYRGVVLSGTAPTTTVPSNGLDWGVNVKATTVNCQQHYTNTRGWNVSTQQHVINTVNGASLTGYLASDSEIYVSSILAAKNENTIITGSVLAVDVLHRLGGTTYGGGVTGATADGVVDYDVDFQSATTQFDFTNSSGNTATNCLITTRHLTTVPAGTVVAANNTLIQGSVVRVRNLVAQNTLVLQNDAGTKQFGVRPDGNIESPLTTTSAIGAYVGKKAEYDAAGTFLGYRPIYG